MTKPMISQLVGIPLVMSGPTKSVRCEAYHMWFLDHFSFWLIEHDLEMVFLKSVHGDADITFEKFVFISWFY
jgi:hypothetical protein